MFKQRHSDSLLSLAVARPVPWEVMSEQSQTMVVSEMRNVIWDDMEPGRDNPAHETVRQLAATRASMSSGSDEVPASCILHLFLALMRPQRGLLLAARSDAGERFHLTGECHIIRHG